MQISQAQTTSDIFSVVRLILFTYLPKKAIVMNKVCSFIYPHIYIWNIQEIYLDIIEKKTHTIIEFSVKIESQ